MEKNWRRLKQIAIEVLETRQANSFSKFTSAFAILNTVLERHRWQVTDELWFQQLPVMSSQVLSSIATTEKSLAPLKKHTYIKVLPQLFVSLISSLPPPSWAPLIPLLCPQHLYNVYTRALTHAFTLMTQRTFIGFSREDIVLNWQP